LQCSTPGAAAVSVSDDKTIDLCNVTEQNKSKPKWQKFDQFLNAKFKFKLSRTSSVTDVEDKSSKFQKSK